MSALKKSNEEIVRLRSEDDIDTYRSALTGHGPQHEAVIEVDRDDDLTSVRSKLESTPLPRAVLVISSGAKTLREGLEYRILRRLQRELGLDIVIVASDMARRGLARENGFAMVYGSMKSYYRSKDSGLHYVAGTPFTDPEEFSPAIGIGRWGIVLGAVLAAIFAALVYVGLPVATVTVYPETSILARDVEVLVESGGPRIDVAAQRLAGRVIEQRVQVQGSINVSEVPPAQGSAQSGNTITLQVRDVLHDRLADQARAQLTQQLRAGLKSTESMPDQSIRTEVIGERYNRGVGDTASELTGYLEVVGTGLAFDNDEFNRLVFALWSQDVPRDFRAMGNPNLTVPAVTSAEGQHMTLRVRASGRVERNVDTEAITAAARWQTPEEAADPISRLGEFARPPEVKVSPSWASRALRVEVNTRPDPAVSSQAATATSN